MKNHNYGSEKNEILGDFRDERVKQVKSWDKADLALRVVSLESAFMDLVIDFDCLYDESFKEDSLGDGVFEAKQDAYFHAIAFFARWVDNMGENEIINYYLAKASSQAKLDRVLIKAGIPTKEFKRSSQIKEN